MKKIKVVGFVTAFIIPIFLTGCGDKKVLTCIQEESVSSIEYKFEFKKEELKKFNIKAQFDFSDVNDVQFESSKKQDFCSNFNTSFDNALKGCKQSVEGKLITVSAEVDLNKFGQKLSGKIEEAKQSFEKEGFKCKIK